MVGALLGMWLGAAAHAGSGPWVLGAGDEQIYLGLEAQRFTTLAVGSGAWADDAIEVDGGIQTFGAKVIGTVGLVRGVEIEAEIPYVYTWVSNPGAVCELLGEGTCDTTQGIGVLALRTKVLILDELAGRPLSLSLGLDLRFGQFTQGTRRRVTALGEGTFDVEPRVALGRIGSVGDRGTSWSVYGDLGLRYRVPTNTDFLGEGRHTPGFEITSTFENLWTPKPVVSVGPAVSMLWRPLGVDWADTDLASDDRFLGLRIFVLEAGAKLLLRNSKGITAALGLSHTLYTINNPQDVLKVSLGVAFRDFVRTREGP